MAVAEGTVVRFGGKVFLDQVLTTAVKAVGEGGVVNLLLAHGEAYTGAVGLYASEAAIAAGAPALSAAQLVGIAEVAATGLPITVYNAAGMTVAQIGAVASMPGTVTVFGWCWSAFTTMSP
jgi:hypothetical protein